MIVYSHSPFSLVGGWQLTVDGIRK